jgi:hypothetical protein
MKVFVSCVSQKNGNIIADISKINKSSFDETLSEWKQQTQGGKPAYDVYKGTQWELIKSLSKLVEVKVVSAGYGIIGINDNIIPYSITFSDAYVENKHLLIPTFGENQKQTNKKWFQSLSKPDWDTDETIIVTVNKDYLNVLDIPNKDNIIVLNNYKLGELAKWLGTGVNNLNVKFTEYLVQNYQFTTKQEVELIINDLIKQHGQTLYKSRDKMNDDDIIKLIKKGTTLKQLRDKNISCSTQRFNTLKIQSYKNKFFQ